MLLCPKCSKTFDEAYKICRDCGAILEPVEESPAEVILDEPSDREDSSFTGFSESETSLEENWTPTPWQCPNCQEAIEANFDACWNCGTTRDGQQIPDFVPVGEGDARPDDQDRPKRRSPDAEPCRRCGSRKVIPNARIGDQGEYSDGKLKALVIGNPEAWIFKDVERSELLADICGECGHVELKVTDPGLLYEHYLRSLE